MTAKKDKEKPAENAENAIVKSEAESNVVDPNAKALEKDEAAEILSSLPDELPQEVKERVTSMMMGFSGTSISRSSSRHPLFDKFSEDHVHKYLDYIQRDDDHAHELKSSNRWFHLTYTIIGVLFFSFLVVYLLPKDKNLLNDILKLLFTFVGGIGSGYGIRSYLDKK